MVKTLYQIWNLFQTHPSIAEGKSLQARVTSSFMEFSILVIENPMICRFSSSFMGNVDINQKESAWIWALATSPYTTVNLDLFKVIFYFLPW